MVEREVIDGIRQEEIDFPKRFASYEEKDYGILFYMSDNKDSYDGNHACIYPDRIEDLGAVLDDIVAFYKNRGIRASIYHPFEKDYFKNNEDILAAHGFTYTPEEDHRIDAKKRLDIHISDYGNTRFDYIVTSKEHRGKGYAGELLSFVVEYCKENKFPVCWQWAGPSEYICYRAGFREMFTMEAGYATGPQL